MAQGRNTFLALAKHAAGTQRKRLRDIPDRQDIAV